MSDKDKEYINGFVAGVKEGPDYNSIFNTLARMIDETFNSADYMKGKYDGVKYREQLDKATKQNSNKATSDKPKGK